MPWIPNAAARRWLASVSTLASATLPPRSLTACSSTGVSWRQGPHQAAQKSTTTGSSLASARRRPARRWPRWRRRSPASRLPGVSEFTVDARRRRAVRRGGRRGRPRRAAARADRDAPLRRDGLARARARRPSGGELRRARPRPLVARAAPGDYGYEALAADLLAVLDDRGIETAVLAGASMGAHTIVRLALDHGDRVAGLVLITPAYTPEGGDSDLERWDALAGRAAERRRGGLRRGLRRSPACPRHGARRSRRCCASASPPTSIPMPWPTRCTRCRARGRSRTGASSPSWRCRRWSSRAATRPIPGHPYAVGERYAREIPDAELLSEEPGSSPLAWQGGQLSKVIAALAERAG